MPFVHRAPTLAMKGPDGPFTCLRYHSKTLQFLGMDPKPTRDSMRALEAVESRIGRRLPSSVREWYELEGACEILLRFSNDDPPLDVRRLGTPEGDTREDGPHDRLQRDLLVSGYEHQGVCFWAVRLDGRR